MSREKYRIGKISELMGLTPEALRFYEREGIILPEKSPSSGYRQYSAWDIHMLIRARIYRKYELTLEETAQALGHLSPPEISDLLKHHEDLLEEAIAEQQRLFDQLKRDRSIMNDAMINIGKFRVENSPSLHFIDTQLSYNIMDDKIDIYSTWIDRTPFTVSGCIFDIFDKNRLLYGLMIEDRNLRDDDAPHVINTTPIPPQKCLMTFFRSGSEMELSLDMLNPIFDIMEDKELTITGNPFARAVLMTKRGRNTYQSWYQAWIPFEGDFEYCSPPPLSEASA